MTKPAFPRLRAAAMALLVSFGASSALAQSGLPPQDVISAEVRSGWVTADGTRMIALHMRLAPGWKTYWRAPGDSGIPPQFSWKGSRNLASVRYYWPRPTVFDLGGLRTVGYAEELILPVELTPKTPGKPQRLKGALTLGVCEEICIPVQLSIDATLDGPGASDLEIHTALASQPKPAKQAGVGAVTCALTSIKDGLQLTVKVDMPSLGAGEAAVIETADPSVWVSQPEVSRSGRTLTAVADLVPPRGQAVVFERSGMRLTVLGQNQAVDIKGCTG